MNRTPWRLAAYLAYTLILVVTAFAIPIPTVSGHLPPWTPFLLGLPLLPLLCLPFLLAARGDGPDTASTGLFLLRTLGILAAGLGHRLAMTLTAQTGLDALSFFAFGGAAGLLLLANGRTFLRWPRAFAQRPDLYPLLGTEEFLRQAALLFRVAGRTSAGLGLVAVETLSDDPFERKQVLFLLLRHSRSHEPWTRSADKRTCVHALVAASETAVRHAEERFRSVLESHTYHPTDPDRPRPPIRIRSRFLLADDDPSLEPEERIRPVLAELLRR